MQFSKTSRITVNSRELFDWHAQAGALERLCPPWSDVEIVSEGKGLEAGRQVELRLKTPLGKQRWLAEHSDCEVGESFSDRQLSGPFKEWAHRHSFRWLNDTESELVDEVEYALPAEPFSRLALGRLVESELERTFRYRHLVTAADLDFRKQLGLEKRLRVLIAGGSGFLGAALVRLLRSLGCEASVLTRSKTCESHVRWDPARGEIERSRVEGFDAIVNLVGENIAAGRWSEERKAALLKSRMDTTHFLVDVIGRLERPPSVLLNASAVGIYGDRGEEALDESKGAGSGFLADLCREWEASAARAELFGVRTVLLRTGVVIDPRAGALQRMLLPARFGVGGPLGDGEQWFPWISLEDWSRAAVWCMVKEVVKGPVNLAAPKIVRQKEFAAVLGSVLGRPAFLPAPKFALRVLFGEMADQALLSSNRVSPCKLLESGYSFLFEEPRSALSFCLGR